MSGFAFTVYCANCKYVVVSNNKARIIVSLIICVIRTNFRVADSLLLLCAEILAEVGFPNFEQIGRERGENTNLVPWTCYEKLF